MLKELDRDREKLRKMVLGLRKSEKTQQEVAEITGVPRPTIARWEAEKGNNVHANNASLPEY